MPIHTKYPETFCYLISGAKSDSGGLFSSIPGTDKSVTVVFSWFGKKQQFPHHRLHSVNTFSRDISDGSTKEEYDVAKSIAPLIVPEWLRKWQGNVMLFNVYETV